MKKKFYRNEFPKVEQFLLNLLKIFKMKFKKWRITRTSPHPWFNSFVPQMVSTFKQEIYKRVDMELLDLKFAWVLSDFYKKSGNLEKAYTVIKRAFGDNLSSTEIVVNNYIMQYKLRPLVCQFIGP